MLKGQIFYFDSVLDQFAGDLNIENVTDLELLNTPNITEDETAERSLEEILQKLKARFIPNFASALKDADLYNEYKIWLGITSPIVVNQDNLKPSTDYQVEILDWVAAGEESKNLHNLLKANQTLTEEGDIAISYGLKVLNFLTPTSDDEQKSTSYDQIEIKNSVKPQDKPSILVISEPQTSPLYLSMGCLHKSFQSDPKLLLQGIKRIIEENSSIELVMIQGENLSSMIDYLQKQLGNEIIVTSFEVQNESTDSNTTFFDRIVKKTLGIRLT